VIRPQLEVDTLILQKEIDFAVEDMPAINFQTGQLEMHSVFHYDVSLYKKQSGEQYYLFKHHKDCTLFIMNCNKDIYDILEQNFITIKDITIFEHSESSKGESLEFVEIPGSYRDNGGYSGMPVIFTD
jgi:hypothetical protein